jgi:hypothetical protein
MENFEFETAVLRFRDLVTGIGETILIHTDILKNFQDEEKYVWWAWWNKGGEQIPLDEFACLNASAKKDELDLFLLDSGSNKLYKVHCTEIEWDKEGARVLSPDKEHTPNYYNEREYLAWFKFTSIEECDSSILERFSYVRVDSLFIDQPSRYVKFYGKKYITR